MQYNTQRRDFLQKSMILGLGAFSALSFPNVLFAQNTLNIWGAPALISLSLAVAIKQGRARDIIPLNYKEWKTPDQLRVGFAGGDFILAASPSNVGVNLYNQGIDIKMLNILTNGLNYIFTKDKNIVSLKDLEGKKLIAPFKNDLPDIVFQALCNAHNINLNKITIQYVQTPPEATMLFVNKNEFDAVITQEPMASAMQLLAKKNGVAVYRNIDVQKLWEQTFKECPQIPQAGLIVRESFYVENKDFFEVFHKDLDNAITWILNNQDTAAKFGAKYLPTPEFGIKAAIPYANFTAKKCSDIAQNLDAFFSIIYQLNPKLLGGKMPPKSLYL